MENPISCFKSGMLGRERETTSSLQVVIWGWPRMSGPFEYTRVAFIKAEAFLGGMEQISGNVFHWKIRDHCQKGYFLKIGDSCLLSGYKWRVSPCAHGGLLLVRECQWDHIVEICQCVKSTQSPSVQFVNSWQGLPWLQRSLIHAGDDAATCWMNCLIHGAPECPTSSDGGKGSWWRKDQSAEGQSPPQLSHEIGGWGGSLYCLPLFCSSNVTVGKKKRLAFSIALYKRMNEWNLLPA